MRVIVVTQFPWDPELPSGGVESVSVNLVSALTRIADCEVIVVTTSKNVIDYTRSNWGRAVIHHLPWAGGTVLWHSVNSGRRQFCRFINSLQPDIVHAHDTYGLLVNGLHVPGVFTIHGFIHADTRHQSGKLAWLRSLVWEFVEKRCWARQSDIIAISPYVSGEIGGVAKCTVHLIDNPVHARFFAIERKRIGNRILSVAQISKLKNTLGLLIAFSIVLKTLPNACLNIAGGVADEGYLRCVREFIEANALNERVKLLGAVSTARIVEELTKAAVLAHVSIQENAPMCIAEAMAAGVPVVATNQFGIPFMVADGASGYLVEPDDPHDVAEKIIRVLTDDVSYDRMSRAGRMIAIERFSPEAVADKTFRVYKEIVGRL